MKQGVAAWEEGGDSRGLTCQEQGGATTNTPTSHGPTSKTPMSFNVVSVDKIVKIGAL